MVNCSRVRSVLKSDDQPGTFKCTCTQCNTCPFIHNADKISGPRRWTKITDRFTGTSANVIYCITCTLCKKIYIGETGRRGQISWIYPPRFPKLRNDATIKQNVTSTHMPPYAYDWPHLPPYLSSLFICYIIVDMPSFPFFCLHLRSMSSYASRALICLYMHSCLHFPSFAFVCLQMPPCMPPYAFSFISSHLSTSAFNYLHMPTYSFICFISAHLSTSAFICLCVHMPSFPFGIYFMGECHECIDYHHECIDYHQCIMGTSVGSALWIYLANLTNFTNLAFLAYFTNLGYLANFTNSG